MSTFIFYLVERGRDRCGVKRDVVSLRAIKKALVEVFRVKPNQGSAFRGRLRHLRKINCPEVPKTGAFECAVIVGV
jgi:hypothetical protein